MSNITVNQENESCEDQVFSNLLSRDSVLNEVIISDLADKNVQIENCQEISTCHDLNCTDHSLHELVDSLSCSSNSNQNPEFLEVSLDDIQLTENDEGNQNALLDIMPESIPQDRLMLLRVPEHLDDSNLLNDIMEIELDQSKVDEIEKAIGESQQALLAQSDCIIHEEVEIIRRPPLQLIQQVIKFPAVKNTPTDDELKTVRKRKQEFQFPREDCVEFLSDDENDENVQQETVNVDITPPPKKAKLAEPIIESVELNTPKTDNKRKSITENCPRCDKSFKKLWMHKCKNPIKNIGIKTLKPSEVPMPLKCDGCKSFFANQEILDKHLADKHSRVTCKICKKVMKNVQSLKLHSTKCGIDIKSIDKFRPKNNKKE